ncbi:hypothetical protein ACLBR5_12530 [Escherichia coli]
MLRILSTFVGALIAPLQGVLPQTTELAHGSMLTLKLPRRGRGGRHSAGSLAVAGAKRTLVTSIANSAPGCLLGTLVVERLGFDWLYDKVFVKLFLDRLVADKNAYLLKLMMNIPAVLSRSAGKGLLLSENGAPRWVCAFMSIGAVVVLALLMVLRRVRIVGLPWVYKNVGRISRLRGVSRYYPQSEENFLS